jgi:hypothetical protein
VSGVAEEGGDAGAGNDGRRTGLLGDEADLGGVWMVNFEDEELLEETLGDVLTLTAVLRPPPPPPPVFVVVVVAEEPFTI